MRILSLLDVCAPAFSVNESENNINVMLNTLWRRNLCGQSGQI
jgi:hypothetical protein